MPPSSLLLLIFFIEISWLSLELCTDTIDLFGSLCLVPLMVPVCASRLRKWRLANIASTSASFVERYTCQHEQYAVKRKARSAYPLNTASAVTVRSTIRRLREQTERV